MSLTRSILSFGAALVLCFSVQAMAAEDTPNWRRPECAAIEEFDWLELPFACDRLDSRCRLVDHDDDLELRVIQFEQVVNRPADLWRRSRWDDDAHGNRQAGRGERRRRLRSILSSASGTDRGHDGKQAERGQVAERKNQGTDDQELRDH